MGVFKPLGLTRQRLDVCRSEDLNNECGDIFPADQCIQLFVTINPFHAQYTDFNHTLYPTNNRTLRKDDHYYYVIRPDCYGHREESSCITTFSSNTTTECMCDSMVGIGLKKGKYNTDPMIYDIKDKDWSTIWDEFILIFWAFLVLCIMACLGVWAVPFPATHPPQVK